MLNVQTDGRKVENERMNEHKRMNGKTVNTDEMTERKRTEK